MAYTQLNIQGLVSVDTTSASFQLAGGMFGLQAVGQFGPTAALIVQVSADNVNWFDAGNQNNISLQMTNRGSIYVAMPAVWVRLRFVAGAGSSVGWLAYSLT